LTSGSPQRIRRRFVAGPTRGRVREAEAALGAMEAGKVVALYINL
jgi:hypothetical protein